MKKLVVFLYALFAIVATGYSQFGNVRLGLELSPTISWMSSSDERINSTGSNLGIDLGAVVEWHMTENVAFTGGVGVAFKQGGTLLHEDGGNFFVESELSDDSFNTGVKPLPDGVKLKYRLQYIELPVAIKFRTDEKGYFRYYAELPVITLGMNTQARGDIESGDVNTEKENIGPDVNFFNLQFGLGGGIEYSLSPSISLVGGLYFNYGVSDITKDSGVKAIRNPDQMPSNPNDDYILETEDSRSKLHNVTLRIAIMF